MKKMFRKVNSIVIALAITASLFTAMPVHASAYLHQDEDAAFDKWTKVENYDDTHGNVYSIPAGDSTSGNEWYTTPFEDGTYVVSMDFKLPTYPASGKNAALHIMSTGWNDRVVVYLNEEGKLAYGSSPKFSGSGNGYETTNRVRYSENAWNNYSAVYVKSGTTINVMQYINGVSLRGTPMTITSTSEFYFGRIQPRTAESDVGFYLDNITCKKISDQEQLKIDSVTPIMREYSNYGVKALRVKFNNILDGTTVSSVQVVKQGGSSNIVSNYRVVGQYIDIDVTGLEKNEGYILTINQGAQSITVNVISANTYTKSQTGTVLEYLHKDEDALLESNKYTKIENYDAEHGSVYGIAAGATAVSGNEWYTSEFADGTYVVSMDFKLPTYPTDTNYAAIHIMHNGWNDRMSLQLRSGGVLAYEQPNFDTTDRVRYSANAWNNYTVVYEKNGNSVDVMQYVNGISLRGTPVSITSNFRFNRIQLRAQESDAGLYVDNIMCRKISEGSLAIESVYPIYSSASSDKVRTLAVKFTEPLNPETVSDVSVVKTEDNLVANYRVVGQYLYVNVNSLLKSEGFTFAIGDGTEGIRGNVIENTSFVYAAEEYGVPYLHKDEDASLESTKYTKVENYDAEHGSVYSIAAGETAVSGNAWYTSPFEDGTYVVSMDFKVPAYPTSGKNVALHVMTDGWSDKVYLSLINDGKLRYSVISGKEEVTDRVKYSANAWNNYTIVYEQSGSTVNIMQYVNGISLRGTAVEKTSNFRFNRIQLRAQESDVGVYVDNIVCRKIDDDEKFAIENVTEIGDDSIQKIAVKFNQTIKPSSIKSVSVVKDETETNIASSYKAVGQYMYINVSDLNEKDGYTISFNRDFSSIVGKGLALSSYKVEADNTETMAYWVCDGSYCDNFDDVTMSNGANISVSNIGGKSCCSVTDELMFTLNENIKPIAFDGSVYKFEIEYYDGASNTEKNSNDHANFFQLIYNQFGTNDLNLDTVVYKNGTSAWKTATITLNNANFYDDYSGDCDFKISLNGVLPVSYATDQKSVNPVQIHSVKVLREVGKNPVFVTSRTSVSGNSFAWYSKDKKITNTYKNVSDISRNITAVTKLIDLSGNESFRYEESINIAPGISKTSVIDFSSVISCGLFEVKVEIIENNVTLSSFETGKIAILKTDPNGVKDKNIFLSVQTEAYDEQQGQVAADILDLMNVAGARVGLSWNRMLVKNNNDEYVLDWDSYKSKSFVTALKERGMTTFGLISGCPPTDKVPNSPGYGHLPVTQSERNAFNEFVEYVGENVVKDGVSYIEFFNEPNLASNNPNFEATGTEYATMAISAKNALLAAAQNAGVADLKVAGPGVTGIQYSSTHPNSGINAGTEIGGYDYIKQAVENGFANSFDNVSFHLYTWSYAESVSSKITAISNIEKLWTDRGLSKPNIWVTEAGYYKGASYSENDWIQGEQNIRQILSHKQNGIFGDVYSIYALERKGYNPALRESNFGLINPLFSNLSIDGCYGLPTESAIMLAAMNYVMPNAEFVSTETIAADLSDIVVSKFTSDKWEGKQIITAYDLDETSETIELDLGVKNVKYFDEFGNESMLASANGIYNVEINSAPVYFVADFDGEADSRTKISVVANGIEYGREEISANIIDFNNFTVKIDNAASLPDEFILITIFYKDGKVVALKNKLCQKNQIVDNKITQVLEDIPDYDNVKITLWNSFVRMEPLCRVLEGK